jgi:hypothetical protein
MQERYLMAAGLIIMCSNFLQVISAFQFIGILVLTIYRMLTGNVLKFLLVYTTLLYGLAAAVYVLGHDPLAEHETEVEFSANEVSVHAALVFCHWKASVIGIKDNSICCNCM